MKIGILVGVMLITSATPAVPQTLEIAQEQQLVLDSEFGQRLDEVSKWLREYQEWEKWYEVWGNRVARNFNDQPVLDRRQRPTPPVWLAADCDAHVTFNGPLATACDILRDWDMEPLRILQRRRSSLVTSRGKIEDRDPNNSSFFQRVHFTGLWMQAQYPAPPAYGIVGLQIGVVEVRRFTVPAIGVMLVMTSDGEGGHSWKPAATLGFGYRIGDFVAPLIRRRASLHFNVARTNLFGGPDSRMGPGASNVNLFGLSVSFKKRP
jgi:hypothetical protein